MGSTNVSMMGSALKICSRRTSCAVLATGVVISLTALTGGVAPAFAKPGDGEAGPTTTVVAPEPAAAPSREQAPAERPSAADVPTAVAPSTPVAPPSVEAPVQTRAPQPELAVEAPVQTRAPEPAPSTEAPVQTRAPKSTPAPAAESTAQPTAQPTTAPSSSAPVPSPRSTVTTTAVSPSIEAPVTSAATPSSASPPPPSPALVAPTESSAGSAAPLAPSESSSQPSPSASVPTSEAELRGTEGSSTSPSASPSASSPSEPTTTAQRVIEKIAPETLEAPEQDVLLAKSARVVEEKPAAAPVKDIQDISNLIDLPNVDRDRRDQNRPRDDDRVRLASDRNWDRNVRQWRPDWVEYDEYYRPVLSNPYRDPVRIVYVYQNAPRVVWIPPLARIVLEVAQFAAYSFTAVVSTAVNTVANVAVGSFFGGGYYPGFGLPLPPPPPALVNYANVPVQVRYPDATYQPFRVNKIVDVGDDAQYGERKVLLDGVTPAWGQWQQTPSGERTFEVHKTQQFPGLDDPRPGPLPGDYQLTLASDESPSGMTNRDVYLVAVAVACGVLSIGAVALAVIMGRRRRPLH